MSILPEELASRYHSGESASQIAASIGLHKCTVAKILRKAGVQFIPGRHKRGTTPEQDLAIVAQHQAGIPKEEIARQHNLAIGGVYSVLRRCGVTFVPNPNAVPHEVKVKMAEAYAAGATAKEAASAFGLSETACRDAIRSLGGIVRQVTYRNKRALSAAAKVRMVQAYLDGSTMAEAASLVGRTASICMKVLRQFGLKARSKARTYTVDATFFQEIDCEQKAWVFGFLAADGYVSRAGRSVSVSVQHRDRDVLDTVRSALKSDAPIVHFTAKTKNGETRHYCSLMIHCTELVSDLIRHGVHSGKSHTVRPWNGPPELMRHYWRGVVDGDGSVLCGPTKNRGRIWQINLVGNIHMVSGFADFVAETIGERRKPWPHRTIFGIGYWKLTTVQQLAKLLYEDAAVYLQRKKSKAIEILKCVSRKRDWSHLTKEGLLELLGMHGTWRSVATHLGINEVSLIRIRRRVGLPTRRCRISSKVIKPL